MTGVTTSSYLPSEEVDLEDGEIASDDEEGKSAAVAAEPQEGNKRPSSNRDRRGEGEEHGRPKGDSHDRRGRRSRPRQSSHDEPERKKKKPNDDVGNEENEDDLVGVCVRGGSPEVDLNAAIWKPKATGHMDTPWGEDEERGKRRRGNSPADRRGGNNFRSSTREDRESRARIQVKRKMKSRKGVADKEVCLNFLKGQCNKGADCFYSHNVCQPRKMELCKFYLKDTCSKRDRCLYLHEEFPCKFFHTGLTCYANKKCKFSHEPLNNFTREVLQKHSNSAQKENNADFQPGNDERIRELMDNNEKSRENEGQQRGWKNDVMNPQRRDMDRKEAEDFTEDPSMNQGDGWRDGGDNMKTNYHGDGPNQRRGGSQENRNSSPANRRRDRSPDNRFNRGNRNSPDRRFGGRGDRNSPDNRFGRGGRGRNDREDRRKGDHDDRRNRNDDNRNFGPRNYNDGPDNRDFNRDGRNNMDNRGFNNDGPQGNRDNFDNVSPSKRNFMPDGPNDNRVNNFGPDGPNMFGGPNNFGPCGPNIPNFGQGDFNNFPQGIPNFGMNGPNFGPNGPNNNFNFGPNNDPNFNNMNGPNFMQNGPNFMGNGPNFGGNQNDSGNFRNFQNDGPDEKRFDGNNRRDQWQDNRNRGDESKNRSRWDGSPRGNERNDDTREKQRPGNERKEKGPKPGKENEKGERERKKKSHHKQGNKHVIDDESNNSGSKSPFDFAKELAEYKNKKMEIDLLNNRFEPGLDNTQNTGQQQDQRERERDERLQAHQDQRQRERDERLQAHQDQRQRERDERLQAHQDQRQRERDERLQAPAEDADERREQTEADFPPKFTQMYPPFPEQQPEKEKRDKEGSSKKHHHHKKKRKHSDAEAPEPDKNKKSRKEKKDKKRQPVIVADDGGFGGIKFKIKFNPGKEEKREVTSGRRPNEFMSSDDEIPLNYLQKKKEKEDGDETDTESRLVIETNEEHEEEKSSPKPQRDDSHYPRHLPKRQQELFMRIQSHQNANFAVDDDCSKRSGSAGDRTPTPEPADQNWYSSDEEFAEKEDQDDLKPLTIDDPDARVSEVSTKKSEPPARSTTPPGPPPTAAVPPKIELAALKDLSKINITELLSSIRQITGLKSSQTNESSTPSIPIPSSSQESRDPRARDPRRGGLSPQGGGASPKTGMDAKRRRSSGEEKPPYAKSIYDLSNAPESKGIKDLDMRFQMDVDHRTPESHFGDVDLRMLGDGPLPPLKLGLPFKPAPLHTAATEIEASLASHPHIDYKVQLIHVPLPDFSSIKISPSDPLVKKDPRLRRLFRVSSVDEPKVEEPKKVPTGPVDPRRKAAPVADTPKSPPSTPFSPPQEPARLPAGLIALVQMAISAAKGAFDPRLRSMVPQELEDLQTAVAGLRPEDLEAFNAMNPPIIPSIPTENIQRPPGLLPTPSVPGLGLLPTPPSFMMNSLMDPMLMNNMGPMGQPMPASLMGPLPGLRNSGGPPFPFGEPPMNDADMRVFRGGRRGGRGNWRGNQRGNWDKRRCDNWDDRDRNRNRDKDRKQRKSQSPD